MTDVAAQPRPVAAPQRTVADRDPDRTAPARCACYAIFSDLVASPHDVDTRSAVLARIGLAGALPYPLDLDELLREFAGTEADSLKLEYSGLFEVGSQGPPAPIREDLHTGQKGGTREEIVRFYDYFGYRLDDRHAWAPDHLSVELEFMHFLCFQESRQAQDRLSYQLAQADFSSRHPQAWVPAFTLAVRKLAPGSLYCRVIESLQEFLARDLDWQNSTIFNTSQHGKSGQTS